MTLSSSSPMGGASAGATFVVNTDDDVDDGACDARHCSLREAIAASNAAIGLDTIAFAIPGGGVRTLHLASALPHVTDAAILDATTQPGYAGMPVVELDGANVTTAAVGLWISAGDTTVRGFAIGGFASVAIFLQDVGGNVVQGNVLGADPTGTVARPNYGGIQVTDSAGNLIGGATAGAGNIISGNRGLGILVTSPDVGSADNVIQGNIIGLDANGTTALGNGEGITVIHAPRVQIGGNASAARNVVSGNGHVGIQVIAAPDAVVEGNYVGLDTAGARSVVNAATYNSAYSNDIGIGLTDAARGVVRGNVVGGNQEGIGAGSNCPSCHSVLFDRIEGNLVGTDAAGATGVPNAIGISASGIATNVTGNLVAGNAQLGIVVRGDGSLVARNKVGTDLTGAHALGNANWGIVVVGAVGATVGGATSADGNLIAYNRGPGVAVFNGASVAQVTIRGNAIFGNDGLAIDLGNDGVTANDASDADSGPNGLQNFPVLGDAHPGSVAGTLDGAPDAAFTLDVYASAACDASGHGPAASLVASGSATTDATGHADFTLTLPGLASGAALTATATDAAGDTSELSSCVLVSAADTTAPTLSLPANFSRNATGLNGTVVTYAASATDDVDGSVNVTCAPPSGSVFAIGTTIVACWASDTAGNVANGTFRVDVGTFWAGFLAPIANDNTSSFKAGSTVPVKFTIGGVAAQTPRLYVAKVVRGTVGAESPATSTSTSDGNAFRYNATTTQYSFNLASAALGKGTFRLRVDLGDGQLRAALVTLT